MSKYRKPTQMMYAVMVVLTLWLIAPVLAGGGEITEAIAHLASGSGIDPEHGRGRGGRTAAPSRRWLTA